MLLSNVNVCVIVERMLQKKLIVFQTLTRAKLIFEPMRLKQSLLIGLRSKVYAFDANLNL